MSEGRLPAALEVAALLRLAEAAGGFGAVLHKGDEAGTIALVLVERGRAGRLFERVPQADGARVWRCIRAQAMDDAGEFSAYLARRTQQDPDGWVVELDVAHGERLIGLGGEGG